MSNRKISVIIPVYNVEPYLEKCVKSVCEQTHSNLEIILVDDGSPDNCPALCDSLAERDSRLRVIHKENGGVSSARNAGLDAATGDYIGFVDGDDYIEPEMYRQLLAALEETHAEIAVCGCREIDEDGRVLCDRAVTERKCLSRTESLALLSCEEVKKPRYHTDVDLHYLFSRMSSKLFHEDLLKTLRFDESLPRGEDVLFVTHAVLQCEKTVVCPGDSYCYVMRSGSTVHTAKLSLTRSSYQSAVKVAGAIENEGKDFPELGSVQSSRLVLRTCSYIKAIAVFHEDGAAYWGARRELMGYMPTISKYLHEYTLKYQIVIFLLRRFPRCFWLATRLRWGRK